MEDLKKSQGQLSLASYVYMAILDLLFMSFSKAK